MYKGVQAYSPVFEDCVLDVECFENVHDVLYTVQNLNASSPTGTQVQPKLLLLLCKHAANAALSVKTLNFFHRLDKANFRSTVHSHIIPSQ